MGKYWKHLSTICRHKKEVLKECWACGIGWQGLIHDLSKFGPTEFVSSARYFQGNRSPIEAEKEEIGYSKAWLHHKGHNKHHWEYWTDFADDGTIIANKIPVKYVIEMMCDWIGAGKVYSKDKWTTNTPYEYYLKVRQGRYFHPDTEALLLNCLDIIKNDGLDAYHKFAKSVIRSGY